MKTIQDILAAHDTYASRYPQFKALLAYGASILNAYEAFLRTRPDLPAAASPPDPEKLGDVLTAGEAAELGRALAELSPAEGMGRALFPAIAFADLEGFRRDPDAALSALEARVALPRSEIALACLLLLKPFFFRIRDRVPMGSNSSGRCPVCASLPYFARIEKEENRRFLACPLCETQWPYPRFSCPFCGVQTTENLCFTAPEWPLHRIDACGGCKAYLKTALEKDRAEAAVPLWEDLVTADLDRAAEAEGFRKVSEYGPKTTDPAQG